jgi:serine/threonine protein kinase/WD40 repeat protein
VGIRSDGGDETETWHKPREDEHHIAQFALVRRLGRGSYGEVWLADDSRLGREVALKLPSGAHAGASTLLHEARTAASLRHPNIVTVYEVGEADGQIYIASEYIEGITLRDYLSQGRPALQRVIDLLIPITEALHIAHEHEVIHRDVKPANILLDKAGTPYVNDFGLAKRLSADETISSEGQVIGTARYMSPEQAYGKTEETDARSDLYAVGVMMFEMLTQESPFRGTARAILQQKISQDAPSPRLLEPSIPRDLDTVCLKCLERDPGKRFHSAAELRDELKRFAAGEPIHSRPISRMERGWRWCKRRPAVSSLLLALFLSLTTGLLMVSYYYQQSLLNAYDAKQKLYRSWMNLAAANASNGNVEGMRDLLSRVTADPELSKMRGFEFGYFANEVGQITTIGGLESAIVASALSADGNHAAATTGDQQIAVIDCANRSTLRVLRFDQEGQEGFTSLDFSPVNNHLAAGSMDGYLRIYDPFAGDAPRRTMQHGPRIHRVAFSPDGKYVMAAGLQGAVRMWDAATGDLVAQLPMGKVEIRAACFSPDSSRIYVARGDGLIREWSVPSVVEAGPEQVPAPRVEFQSASPPVAMAVTCDGERLMVALFNGTILLRDLPLVQQSSSEQSYETNWGLIHGIEHLQGTSIAAVTASSGNLYLFDLHKGHEIRLLGTHTGKGILDASSDGKVLLVGSGDGSVSKLDSARLVRPAALWHAPVVDQPTALRSVGILSNGEVLAGYENGDLIRWDSSTGNRNSLVSTDQKTMLIAVNPAKPVFATAGSRQGVDLRDAASGDVVANITTGPAGVSALRFSPSGDLLAVAARQGSLRVFNFGDWLQPRFEIPGESESVTSLAISADDRLLAVAQGGHAVVLRSTDDGSLLNSIPIPDEVPTTVEFCQDGVTLAIGSNAGSLFLWDLPSQRMRVASKGHSGRINCLAMMPGSKTIVSAGRDKDLRLWDLESGELITQLVGHNRQVFSMAVSPDRNTIVSGGLEGDLRIWRSNY